MHSRTKHPLKKKNNKRRDRRTKQRKNTWRKNTTHVKTSFYHFDLKHFKSDWTQTLHEIILPYPRQLCKNRILSFNLANEIFIKTLQKTGIWVKFCTKNWISQLLSLKSKFYKMQCKALTSTYQNLLLNSLFNAYWKYIISSYFQW